MTAVETDTGTLQTGAAMGQSVPRKEDNRLVQGQGMFVDDVKLNAVMVDHRDSFEVSPHEEKPKPSAEQIEANKKKWSWAG